MSLPKNKGLRKIVINDIEYYWKIDKDIKTDILKVTIGKVLEPNKRIILSLKDSLETEDGIKNQIINPQLIKDTIKYAVSDGWENQEKIKPFLVKLENQFFETID